MFPNFSTSISSFLFLINLGVRLINEYYLVVYRRALWKFSETQASPLVQESTTGDSLTSQPSGMSCFSEIMSSNLSTFEWVKPHFFEMWIFWRPENLNLTLYKTSITCPFLQLGADGHGDQNHENSQHWALGFPKSTMYPLLDPKFGKALQLETLVMAKNCFQVPLEQLDNSLHTLPKRLMFTIILHWFPVGKRTWSA